MKKVIISCFALLLVATVFGTNYVFASSTTYNYGSISSLSSGSTKKTSSQLTVKGTYTLTATKSYLSGSSAKWTAYVIEPSSNLFGSDSTLAYGAMNLTSTTDSYSIGWGSTIDGGYKYLKFVGSSGTVSFTASLKSTY